MPNPSATPRTSPPPTRKRPEPNPGDSFGQALDVDEVAVEQLLAGRHRATPRDADLAAAIQRLAEQGELPYTITKRLRVGNERVQRALGAAS